MRKKQQPFTLGNPVGPYLFGTMDSSVTPLSISGRKARKGTDDCKDSPALSEELLGKRCTTRGGGDHVHGRHHIDHFNIASSLSICTAPFSSTKKKMLSGDARLCWPLGDLWLRRGRGLACPLRRGRGMAPLAAGAGGSRAAAFSSN